MFGHKRLSREVGIEIVIKVLCTRMVEKGCLVTCYTRARHHVSGAQYDNIDTLEDIRIKQRFVPPVEYKGLAAVSSAFFCSSLQCIRKL